MLHRVGVGNNLMTFSPAQAGIQTGEDYWTSIGILGASTGMSPIISANTTIPAVDAYSSQLSVAVTDSVLKYTHTTGSSNRQCSWNLGATKSKLLAISHFNMGTSLDIQAIFLSQDTYSGSQGTQAYFDNAYYFANYPYSTNNNVGMLKVVSTTHAWLTSGTDATICVNDDPFAHSYGLAFYSADHVQKAFLKVGSTSQWIQIFSLTDESLDVAGVPFQSVGIQTGHGSGQIGRMISPFYVWGA